LGPVSLTAHGGTGVVVKLDGGTGGTLAGHVAPWVPSLTERRDRIRTADNITHLVHGASSEQWSQVTGIGATSPSVTTAGDALVIRFFDTTGEPLPAVTLSLVG